MAKRELIFDVCWEVYRGAREVLEEKRGISAMNAADNALMAATAGRKGWRPEMRPRLVEWVADFALAGNAALEGPEWASRMVLFRLYYLGLAPYANARHFLGIGELAWVQWTELIRNRVGGELWRRGMFPPRNYFKDAS